jgi:hypothetical protein
MASRRYYHTGFSCFRIGRSAIDSAAVAARWSSYREVRAMCAIISTLVSGLLPMMDSDHDFVGSKGIVTLT